MATSASPTVSTEASPNATENPSPNLPISPASLFNNLPHRVTAQLTRDNYLTWQWQMVTYLKSQNAYGFVEGTVSPPPQTIPNPNPTADSPATIANPAFLTWLQHDQMVLSTLVSTISENSIPQHPCVLRLFKNAFVTVILHIKSLILNQIIKKKKKYFLI
jgi:hypothetical protein